VPWAEFRTAFRGHHIPAGLMAHKLQEFLHLQQGSSSMYEYSKKFNHLSQYDSYHADTDEKKMSLFCQGLSPVLREHLMLFRGCTLDELVSTSIEQEDACRAHLEEERKKRPLPGPNGGRFTQVPPGLHSTLRAVTWSPFITAVEPPSTSAGGPTSSCLPVAGCSTSSSATGWGRVSVLQLWANWALLP
jgi:hypothetical protein